MKKRIVVLLVAAFVIFGLSLYASGAKDSGTEGKAAATGEPQYGGTLTYIQRPEVSEGIPDVGSPLYPMHYFISPIAERIFRGDVETFGPRGTGEFRFHSQLFPEKYLVGNMVEGWDITPDKFTLHVREGVYFSGKSINPVMKEPREYTADDFVFNLEYLLEGTAGAATKASNWIKSINATDKYTVVLETSFLHPEWYMAITGLSGYQVAPESIKAGARDWNNIVGTGPFYLKEYQPGSHFIYERNDLYYRKTTIDGKEYQIPFVDKAIYPVVKDEATAIASIRTGKIDMHHFVDWVYQESLGKTSPDLLSSSLDYGGGFTLKLRADRPPTNDVNVRRALMIGTDLKTITESILGRPWVHFWPLDGGQEGHIPMEKLPASAQELYTYDAAKAKQMLVDAGYPDGFKLHMIVETRPLCSDLAERIASEWERDFGVELTLEVVDTPIAASVAASKPDKWDSFLGWMITLPPFRALKSNYHSTNVPPNMSNKSSYQDPEFDALYEKAEKTIDKAERQRLMEELFVKITEDVPAIPIPFRGVYVYWWPWVKNFYGENYYWWSEPPYDLIWIDQDLKKKMGK